MFITSLIVGIFILIIYSCLYISKKTDEGMEDIDDSKSIFK